METTVIMNWQSKEYLLELVKQCDASSNNNREIFIIILYIFKKHYGIF